MYPPFDSVPIKEYTVVVNDRYCIVLFIEDK